MPSIYCQQLKNLYLVAQDQVNKNDVAAAEFYRKYNYNLNLVKQGMDQNLFLELKNNLDGNQYPMTLAIQNFLITNTSPTLSQIANYFNNSFWGTRKQIPSNWVLQQCYLNRKCISTRENIVKNLYLFYFQYYFCIIYKSKLAKRLTQAKNNYNQNSCDPPIM